VDEVQRCRVPEKAIGKMQDIFQKSDGRTVLFVSHNMAAVKSFSNEGILIENGKTKFDGKTADTLMFIKKENNLNIDRIFWRRSYQTCDFIFSKPNNQYKSALKSDVYIETKDLIKKSSFWLHYKRFEMMLS
jgi:lipopolysaccharide transport system ATP-binding protein